MSIDIHSADAAQVDPTASPPIRATVYVGRWPDIPALPLMGIPKGTFSPTTSTIISGASEAILIDTQYLKQDIHDLGDLIERTGKRLTTIYITHPHADHYLGLAALLERFPSSRCVALPHVVESMRETMEMQNLQWERLFGAATVKGGPLPEPIENTPLYVDGSPVNIIAVEQADINPTTIVHIPEIDVVVAGDAIYNEIHPMLGLSTPDEWQSWLATVRFVENLHPRMIVAGHRRPDGDDYAVAAMIAQTRSYITDFAAAFEIAETAADLVAAMTAKYPHHGNLWTLQFSASDAIERRNRSTALTDAN
ncbi:Glyoxylase or a related metal-dependent hydrolase, beta-lactamase superfamily II [Mycobacterium rhizamassiliense]|jgi:glyoxylase-like metal-dependent hydrolase (beta-lactamase superfamily II)|uniref:Glyoxylase or a related metal-dependent hydrolase, beta-lactamase superfamily II n=1 Tax=Mycobacterium rhizamassiliense TaxID=1841860 RepID=A0A2U3P0B4_9MYCO|nr:MBL fold metallo-hydrolase [Mycobacterium rhizamassiliense]SPM37177.1 Glyoxylase or a related metal-dependent hydrolase, beta-lactamase superfamily II [Mycobacterium rhizamassiliense]